MLIDENPYFGEIRKLGESSSKYSLGTGLATLLMHYEVNFFSLLSGR